MPIHLVWRNSINCVVASVLYERFTAIDTRELDASSIRARIGLVSADAALFNDTTTPSKTVAVGSTGYGVARVMISGGAHAISGTAEFGIVVYGFGEFTSYMYPGGLDLEAIDVPF